MLHKYKIGCGKYVLFTYVCRRKAISFEYLPVCCKKIDIHNCLQQMYVNRTFSMCDFMFIYAPQQSYLYGQSLKKGEILDLLMKR